MSKGPTLTPGTRLCQCGACGQFFASPTGFDGHRREGQCTPARALKAAGWRKVRGFWTLPREEEMGDGDKG